MIDILTGVMYYLTVPLTCISLNISDVVFVSHLYVWEKKKSLFRSFSHFFIGLFGLLILCCLYILKINPLLMTSFANIFSHSESCLFVLFMVSFDIWKLLSLIRSYFFVLFLFSLGIWSKKILLQLMSKNVLPMFSSKSFIVWQRI